MSGIFNIKLSLFIIFLAYAFTQTSAKNITIAINTTPISMKLLNGKVIKLGVVRDRPLYLKFWASWCGKCQEEVPHLNAIYKKYRGKLDVVAVNVSLNETMQKVTAFKKKFKLVVPIAYELSQNIAAQMKVVIVPYSIVINRKGRIVYKTFGVKGVNLQIEKLFLYK